MEQEYRIMKDELISFSTAKLAKDKGFDVPCITVYLTNEMTYDTQYYDSLYDNSNNDEIFSLNHKETSIVCSAPTQSLLQRWLREKHGISVLVSIDGELMYNWDIFPLSPTTTSQEAGKNYYVTGIYEEALEEALLQALKLI